MIGTIRRTAALTFCLGALALSGCKSSEDKEFLANCETDRGMSGQQCSCLNDLVNESFEDKGRTYMKALIVGDQSKAAQIQTTFGIVEGGQILTRAAWFAANAPQACNVKM